MSGWKTGFYIVLAVEWFTLAVFVAWTLQRAWTCASEVLRAKSKRKGSYPQRFGSNDVLCPRLFGRLTTVQFTMGVTIASILLILLNMILNGANFILLLTLCGGCQLSENPPKSAEYVWGVAYFCTFVAYILLLVTHFERLRLTFKNSTQRLPKDAPKLLYSAITAIVVSAVGAFMDNSSKQLGTAIGYATIFLVYAATISGLIVAWFKRTTAIAKGTEVDTSRLTDAALRVAMSATLSLLSTAALFIYVILWVCVAQPNNRILMSCMFVIYGFDDAVNAFCLLCAFREAAPYYHVVFGRLHAYCLSLLLREHSLNEKLDQEQDVAPSVGD